MMSGCKKSSDDKKRGSGRHLVDREHRDPWCFGWIGDEPWPAEEVRAHVHEQGPLQ